MSGADQSGLRDQSAAILGNAKMCEVVLALAELNGGTARKIEQHTNIAYTMVRDVLVRLDKAGLVETYRDGGTRGPLLYWARVGPVWDSLLSLCASMRTAYSASAVPSASRPI